MRAVARRLAIVMGLLCGPSLAFGAELHRAPVVRVFRVDAQNFPVVDIFCRVVESNGNPIRGLTSANFNLLENHVTYWGSDLIVTPIASIPAEARRGLALIFLIDNSLSVSKKKVFDLASGVIRGLSKEDEVAIVIQKKDTGGPRYDTSGKPVLTSTIWHRLSTDRQSLLNALQDYYHTTYSPLLDSLYYVAETFDRPELQGRAAVVLFTDGQDKSSRYGLNEVAQRLDEAGLPVFIFGVKSGFLSSVNTLFLRTIATRTCGKYFPHGGAITPEKAAQQIVGYLESAYRIRYRSVNMDTLETSRRVIVSLTWMKRSYQTIAGYRVAREQVIAEVVRQGMEIIQKWLKEYQDDALPAIMLAKKADETFRAAQKLDQEGKYVEALEALARAKADASEASRHGRRAAVCESEPPEVPSDAQDQPKIKKALARLAALREKVDKARQLAAKVEKRVAGYTLLSTAGSYAERKDSLQMREALIKMNAAFKERKGDIAFLTEGERRELYRRYARLVEHVMTDALAKGYCARAEDAGRKALEIITEGQTDFRPVGIFTLLAKSLLRRKEAPEAIDFLKRAMSGGQVSPDVYYLFGQACWMMKKPEEAVRALKQCLELDPNQAEARKLLGRVYFELKDFNRAREMLGSAEVNGSDIEAKMELAVSCLAAKEFGRARDLLQEILRRDEANAMAHLYLARALAGLTPCPLDAVVEHAQVALKLGKLDREKEAEAHDILGQALYKQDKWDEGVAECLKAVELDPSRKEGHPILRGVQ